MKPETFKAAIYRGIKQVEVEERPYPVCGDDDVIVKNLIAGICGSDISAYYKGGDANMIWKDSEFGHEVVSEVVEVGKNVKDIQLGDHVFPNMGQAKRDRMRMATVGGFSEYIHIPQFELGYSAVKIDKKISTVSASLLEPFVVGTRGAKNANPGPGKTAIVFGAGTIGMSAAIMLKWYGCDKVMIVDISDYRLENAKKYDLIVCNPKKDDLKDMAIAEFGMQRCYTGEACGANIFIDATGIQATIDDFKALAGRNAFLSVVGVHKDPVTLDFVSITYNNWYISGSGNGSYEEVAVDVLAMMASGQYDLDPLVSHKFKQSDICEAIEIASNSEVAQKVVIQY
ncbi:alcohol dehydrogenase catalytic domain-containing protein [Fusibacter paucivorans]|uniref:Alcohol dehydrogenase catalytic domain-containing protein n=1 Tax=Fusibacter paucivorans TaxID=76009 RepID=A0ABS5PQW8_9FIRM|nr:zinc-binding dehydrogenase [Fusibacter paucivorans]MBS7526996.1 alcohol dehydrogenase catalytic domain-containing protein [Fusibacter paucivorans]